MNLSNFKKFLEIGNGDTTTNIYLPSIKRFVPFKSLTVADVKTIARLDLFSIFDINNELIKLSLFDKLILEDKDSCGVSSENITRVDYLSFLIGIRQLLDNNISFTLTCENCKEQFSFQIDIEQAFYPLIQKFQRKNIIFEKTDFNNHKWKFELNSYTMKDYLYYRYYIEEIKQIENENFRNDILSKPLLYITKIYRDDEEIDDWKDQTLVEKFEFFNSLPSEIILNTKISDPNDYLITFILNNFDEELIEQEVNKFPALCEHCGHSFSNVFSFEDFVYVLGYASDNQEIYSSILETETYLLYYHWLTLDQINAMSYLDFSIYSERIFALYEEEQKQKEEELKAMENQVQEIEIVSY